ncbi:hypothetical protein [Methylomonas sp. AM2-LC]|uniref:hypothetical protein n=1 Tax=Methylomonas sp. AM2-LC TaxID=3153301 RepID=UPI003263AA57
MPVTKIKVSFTKFYAFDSADLFGAGEWKMTAKIDGQIVGDPNYEFEVNDKQTINLSEKWSRELDVRDKKPGDTILISMTGIDVDVFSDDNLGEAKLTLKYPFVTEYDEVPVRSAVIKGWLFLPDHQYYQVYISVKILETKATTKPDLNKGIVVSRQNNGNTTFTTVSGKAIEPRVEVCPVIPVPIAPTKLPPRPSMLVSLSAEVEPGVETAFAKPITLAPTSDWNVLVNPSLIPVLKKDDPNITTKAAKIAVTWVWPGDLELSKITWKVKQGPAEIVGSNRGIWVMVRGTAASSDTMAVLEARWDGEDGPLLATYRAWVGGVKQLKYRMNIINGVDKTNHPERSPTVSPGDLYDYIRIAQVIWWQCGIEFIPDTNNTTWDNALPSANQGIFTVTAQKDNWTVNVNNNVSPISTRLNFNPGVLNVAFVRSTTGTNAAATDLQGVSGKSVELDGAPSSSWVLPSGVPPDGAAGKIKMTSFPHQNRSNSTDHAYINARKKLQASFTSDDLHKRLYGIIYPSDWTVGSSVHASGQNLAHEMGHILGLYHRGSGGENNFTTVSKLSDDQVNCVDTFGNKRGHPWRENVMGYDVLRGMDADLLQTMVVRKHPGLTDKT